LLNPPIDNVIFLWLWLPRYRNWTATLRPLLRSVTLLLWIREIISWSCDL